MLAEWRIRLYQLLDPLAPAFLVRRRSGDLVSALLGDLELIELFYAHTISPLFVAILVPGGVLIALGLLAPQLALVPVPFLVAVALTPLLAARQSAHLGAALRDRTGEVTAHAVDSVQGLRTIAAFNHGAGRASEIAARSRELGELKRMFLRAGRAERSCRGIDGSGRAGGPQRRGRVSIARALLKDAPILVLDEATSHLDAVSEAEVRQALDRLRAGRTTLVIAHRLSTIRDADEIVVLDEGRVVERGTHSELVAQDGLYSHLIASQLHVTAARSEEPIGGVN